MSSRDSKAAVLAASGLTVGYRGRRGRTVLRDVSPQLRRGELVAVLGPNGAGKSTLLGTLAGMLPPLAGHVELDGQRLDELSPRQRARRIGVVLPERVAPGMLSVSGLVALGRHPHTGWSGRLQSRDRTIVQESLAAVGISHLQRRDVASLSDGERQKVMIARALAQEPEVLILDEPTAFLDLPGRVDVIELLAALARRETGGAVLMSTHDLDLALRRCDQVWLIGRDGSLRHGTPGELLAGDAFESAFESRRLRDYLPDSRAVPSDP